MNKSNRQSNNMSSSMNKKRDYQIEQYSQMLEEQNHLQDQSRLSAMMKESTEPKRANEFDRMVTDLLQDSCYNVSAANRQSFDEAQTSRIAENKKSPNTAQMSARGSSAKMNNFKSPAKKSKQKRTKLKSPHQDSVNIQISVKQKEPNQLMLELKETMSLIEDSQPNSREYLLGLNLEIELKKYLTPAYQNSIPDDFYIKIDQFIRDHSPNQQTSPSKGGGEHCSSPQQMRKHVKIPSKFQDLEDEKKDLLLELLMQYEHALCFINAKEVQRFKNLTGKGCEKEIGQCLMYLFSAFDIKILLSNDKKTLLNCSWENIKRYFSNSGNLIGSLKKLRTSLEKNELSNIHFSQILSLQSELPSEEISKEDSVHEIFCKFLEAAIQLARFIKVEINQVSEESFKSNKKSYSRVLQSPDPKQRLEKNLQYSSYRKRMMSPEQKTTNDDIHQLHHELYSKETDDLIKSAVKMDKIKNQKNSLLTISSSINKLKFEMEREEREALKLMTKQEEKNHIEWQKEQIQKNQLLKEERMKQEKEEFAQRQQQIVDDLNAIKQKKKVEQEYQKNSMKVDINKEKEYKNTIIQKQREEVKDTIDFKMISIKEKERIQKEEYMKKKVEEQELREKERDKEIKIQLKDLQSKERSLQEEINILQQLRAAPIKVPGKNKI